MLLRAEGRVFCSGADLAEATGEGMEQGTRRIVDLQRLIVAMDKPVVTRLHGAVRAGGIGIVAASDLVGRGRGRHVRADRGQARAGRRDHLADRAPPDDPAGGGAHHARWRGVLRRRRRGVRAGDHGRARRGARRRGGALCASLATGAPQGLRESKRILNRDLLARIDEHGDEMARLSTRLFASDEARDRDDRVPHPEEVGPPLVEEVAQRPSRDRRGSRRQPIGRGQRVSTDMTALAATRDTASDPGGPVAQRLEFDEFVAARSRALLRTAYLLTHDHALAEDLLQTALTKAWFAWSRIEGRPEPYVRRVLVNTYATWWRRKWNGELATEELPEPAGVGTGRPTPGPATPATTCGRPWTGCRAGSAPWWCCATSRTSPRPRPPELLGLLGRDGQEPDQQGAGQAADRPRAGHRPGRGPAMNTLDDLRSTLDRHASGLPDAALVDRAAAVRGRVRVVRRRRQAGVGGVAAAVVAAVALTTSLGGRPAPVADRTLAGHVAPLTDALARLHLHVHAGAAGRRDRPAATSRPPSARSCSTWATSGPDDRVTLRGLERRAPDGHRRRLR